MNKKLFLFSLLALFLMLFLVACSSSEEASGDQGNETKEEKSEDDQQKENEKQEKENEIIEPATSVEEIIKQEPGEFAGHNYNEAVVHRDLDGKHFQEKSSLEVYSYLLTLMGEGDNYTEYHDYFKEFNPHITTELTNMPGGMQISDDNEISFNTNIAILVDSSGSMGQKIAGYTKMELAKNAVNEFVASMPEGSNVMLRVYGHKGSSSDKDKKLSCGSTEVVYDFQPYNEKKFGKALDKFEPKGWTPLAKAISETKKDFENAEKGKNIIYIVSDGVATCGGDPAKASKELHDSNIEAVVNIIGFDVDNKGQEQLLSVAEAGGGEFETVDTAEDFKSIWKEERQRLWSEWYDWGNENWNAVWDEQTNKKNELWDMKNDVGNLIYDEKSRMKEASYYLQQEDQYESDMRQEIDSLIEQRYEILDDYISDTYDDLKETLETEGDDLKDAIEKKGEEMKEK
ncbi:hypothetical protein CFK37_12220 [Virgibacillus phasianinus]|uniref:VWFA domain-containing protein n=1 Tax=Virgibacillus phasianinus TaxID=2017483 RepID=A0A220U415_9BACI|nr:VWA domain-containing protein [Virgibacillus phasianinus]ASK62859.1 hypothetical protein CFK37_12220 [Virgibacillus phasianinus]